MATNEMALPKEGLVASSAQASGDVRAHLCTMAYAMQADH
jgi:hypothetical protein